MFTLLFLFPLLFLCCNRLITDIGVCFTTVNVKEPGVTPSSFSPREKLHLLNHHFTAPTKHFRFPAVREAYGKKRNFQLSWLELYPWLVYSEKCNGGFCLPCILFRSDSLGTCQHQLINSPMVNFTRAAKTLQKHNATEESQCIHEPCGKCFGKQWVGNKPLCCSNCMIGKVNKQQKTEKNCWA